MRIFITGATGFIGLNLVRCLVQSGHHVDCLVRTVSKASTLPQSPFVQHVPGDLSTPGNWETALQQAEAVVHLAGVTRARNPAGYMKGNVETTRNLLDAINRQNADIPILYASSQAGAGPCATGLGIDETAPKPVSWYGRSKREAENLVMDHAQGRTVIIRPAMVYGAGDKDFLPLFQAAKRGVIPTHRRDAWPVSIVHVSDVVRFLNLALEDASVDGTYFVASSERLDWKDVLVAVSNAMETRSRILPVPMSIIRALTFVTGLLATLGMSPAYLNPDKYREMQQEGWLCDARRARHLLGQDSMTLIDEGMKQTAHWYRDNGLL